MKVIRLLKIKKYRGFRDFSWPENLPAFAQFNVIYGWNGSGKTAISSLLAHLQEKSEISEGDVEFELDGDQKISGNNIPTANVPSVRVFNRDFVIKTLEQIDENNVTPIYFLGEKNIEKQKQVEKLKQEKQEANNALENAMNDKSRINMDLEKFCTDKAKLIKEALLGSSDHQNYNKHKFKIAIQNLKEESPPRQMLSDEEKRQWHSKKEQRSKPPILSFSMPIPNMEKLRLQTAELLQRSVASKIIDELARDTTVGSWVQQGLDLHQGEHETDTCRFCGNELSVQRRTEIEAHFNTSFSTLQQDIDKTITAIEDSKQHLLYITKLPEKSRFYDNLLEDISSANEKASTAIMVTIHNLNRLKTALENKKTNPFKSITLEEFGGSLNMLTNNFSEAIDRINSVIEKQKQMTENLNETIKKACQILEQNYVLEALADFEQLTTAKAKADNAATIAGKRPAILTNTISKIENKIVEHRIPAERLNHELRTYLGHDELKFEVKETGYTLTRGGQPALHLSEGERTAITFLYFLISLSDKNFDLTKGVVVIDDPVSSLDTNALFSAFGYMKNHTKECCQLFILTHNFAFFRLVRNWLRYMNKIGKSNKTNPPSRFYGLITKISSGVRTARLSMIDPLLEKFESEYHFLFRKVHDAANNLEPNGDLIQSYGMPNIARRLLETFLAYSFPDCTGSLEKKLDRAEFDSAEKTRIIRFLHTYSHAGGISDPEHDPSVLAETNDVMKKILELIRTINESHHQGMMDLMETVNSKP